MHLSEQTDQLGDGMVGLITMSQLTMTAIAPRGNLAAVRQK